jgi:hypothetical protein
LLGRPSGGFSFSFFGSGGFSFSFFGVLFGMAKLTKTSRGFLGKNSRSATQRRA